MPASEAQAVDFVFSAWKQQRHRGYSQKELPAEEAGRLLVKLASHYAQTTIVVDGLDECDRQTRHELMDALEKVIEDSTSLVKVFVASRDDRDLVDRYMSGNNLWVEASHNRADIAKFVQSRMDNASNSWFRTKMTPDLRDHILKVFREKSSGM